MTETLVPVRFWYRSESMIPPLSVAREMGMWERHGLAVEHLQFTDDPMGAEEELFSGRIDFIFGNHVTPYMRLARGQEMVCLAQSENWDQNWVATRSDITDLRMLNGKRVIAYPLFINGDEFAGHARGTRLLTLAQQGVDLDGLEMIDPESISDPVRAVNDDEAEAFFVSEERAAAAESAGLRVHRLAAIPMVHNLTLTTTPARLKRKPDFAEATIRVMIDAVHFLKTRRADTMRIVKSNPVGDLRPGQLERLESGYEEHVGNYEGSLYPTASAIANIHQLACMVYPEAKSINPLELWDLSALRNVHASGYVEELYGGRAPLVAGPDEGKESSWTVRELSHS